MFKKAILMTVAVAALSLQPTETRADDCTYGIRSAISVSGVAGSALRSDYSALRRASSQLRRLERRGGDLEAAAAILHQEWSCTYTQHLLSHCSLFRTVGAPEELPGVCTLTPPPESIEDLIACVNQVSQQVRSSISETRKYQRQLRSLLRTAMRGGCEGIQIPHAPVWCQDN